jgi:hypothetical protein
MRALVADLEDEHQVPARREHPVELGERLRPALPWQVNDREQREHPTERRVR